VKVGERGKFFLELISGIENRIPESSMAYYLKVLAAEECCNVWDYSELRSNKFLSTTYVALGSKFTSKMLAGRSQFEIPSSDQKLEDALRVFSNQLGIASFGRSMINSKRNPVIEIASKLPLSVKMILFKVYVRLRAIKQPNYYWNVFWK